MATYVVNAASASPGSPFADESTGAHTFKELIDTIDVFFADGDIIEVYDNAEIDDSGTYAGTITKDITIRSHSSNTAKPVVKVNNGGNFLNFVPGAVGTFKVQNIKMYKDGPGANGAFLVTVNNAFASPEVTGCEFVVNNITTRGATLSAVQIQSNCTFSGAFLFKDNDIDGLYDGISMNEPGGAPA